MLCVITQGYVLANSSSLITLFIKDQCMVRNDMVRLKDVASVAMETPLWNEIRDISLSKTPLPGLSHHVSKFDLLRAFRQNDIDVKLIRFEGSSSTEVFGAFQKITVETLEHEAFEFYTNSLGLDDETYRVEIEWRHRMNDVYVPEGDVEIRYTVRSDRPFFGTIVLNADIYINEAHIKSCSLMGNKYTFADVWVAVKDIQRGEYFETAMFQLESKKIRKKIDSIELDDDSMRGSMSIRRIAAGSIFDAALFAMPVVIEKGQMVQARLKSGLLEILLPVKSKSDGRAGEVISVVNMNSGAILMAKVMDSQNVEVVI